MKKFKLKKWVEKLLSCLFAITLALLCTTVESDFSIQFFIFEGLNMLILILSAYLITKYGTSLED